MDYKTWQSAIFVTLLKEGFEINEAIEQAKSMRGCYYDKDNYKNPKELVYKLINGDRVSILERAQLRKRKRKTIKSLQGQLDNNIINVGKLLFA